MPRSYPSPRSDRPRPQTAPQQAPAARLPLEPGPLGDPDAVDVGVGLEDLVVARRGQDVDRRLGIGRPQPGDQRAGEHRVAQVVELDDQDSPRGDRPARAGRTHRQAAIATVPTASSAWTRIRHRSLL